MGFITDSYTIFGTKRKFYLIISSIVQTIAWLYLSFYVNEFWGAVIVKLLINIASGFINVIGEAIMVELSQKK
jgi:MFS-type transporter involved in bile tolerance (Atg22 family)